MLIIKSYSDRVCYKPCLNVINFIGQIDLQNTKINGLDHWDPRRSNSLLSPVGEVGSVSFRPFVESHEASRPHPVLLSGPRGRAPSNFKEGPVSGLGSHVLPAEEGAAGAGAGGGAPAPSRWFPEKFGETSAPRGAASSGAAIRSIRSIQGRRRPAVARG